MFQVRKLTRKSFVEIRTRWPNVADRILNTLDIPTRKQLEAAEKADVETIAPKPAAAAAKPTEKSITELVRLRSRQLTQSAQPIMSIKAAPTHSDSTF